MVEVRTKFQPRQLLEVSEQEAEVLAAQCLLWEGTDEDLAQLLAADPVGPLDPRPVPITTDKPAAKQAPATAAPAADAKPADTAKGA